jgi:hypothetical protein
MRHARLRQIARLEKLAQPFLKRKGDEDEQWTSTIEGAANHAAVLAFPHPVWQTSNRRTIV